MKHAWAVLGLGLWATGVGGGALCAQGSPPTVELKQNYPNPVFPATTIPFTLNGELFAHGHRPRVSLKIYNVLAQVVAVPVLQGVGEPLDNVALSCADPTGCSFAAWWNGKVGRTGESVASGVYLYQLVVDGTRYTKKMVVMK
jgi:hypothetical protein